VKKASKLPLPQMRELVQQELDHIPRWPKETQSYLRQSYWFWRMNSLGKKAEVPNNPSAVLEKCLDDLAKERPGETFAFDAAFFDVPPRRKKGGTAR
jgi:hypothetical protein